MEAARRARETTEAAHQAEAAARASALWAQAPPAPDVHPYLVRKGIAAHGARLHGGALVLPVRDGATLHSLQFIDDDGGKRFLAGGRVAGCYYAIGTTKEARALAVCEGFATAASVHAATGHPAAVAFTAGNLEPVARALRAKYPTLPLIVCADDDAGTPGNPGLTRARAAAAAVGGRLAVPDWAADRPEGATDFNDLARHQGPEAVARALAAAGPAGGEPTATAGTGGPEVALLRACDVTPEAVAWLWDGWLAEGKVHVLGGAPGTGKTTLALAVAATLTTGGRWPDGTRAPIADVAIWSGEDDPKDTLVPRLALAGAELGRVWFVADVREGGERRPFDPARDMEPLQRELKRIGGVKLLIVDPIVSAIAGDSHKNAEVRRGLQPLTDLAEAMRCAVLGVTHFSKGTGGREPVERLTGSLAFGAVARLVWVAAKCQEADGADGPERLLCRAKSNIGPDGGGYGYDLRASELPEHPGVIASCVAWGAPLEGEARALLATAEVTAEDDEGGTLTDAKRFLADLLADGPMPSKAIKADADGAGYSWATIRRAQKALGIEPQRSGGLGRAGTWAWALPPKVLTNPYVAQQKKVSTLGNIEHLRDNGDRVEVEL